MGCNCKRAIQLEKKYGVEIKESMPKRIYRTVWKAFVVALSGVMGIVVVPAVISVLVYNRIFKNEKGITISKKLLKHIM